MKILSSLLVIILPIFFYSCQSAVERAVKDTKYSAYEFFGIEKRDLFKKEVKNVKNDQESTGESFKNALDKLKAIYAFDGGNLEKQYRSLESSYQLVESRVNEVHKSVKQVETVAGDLFTEWRSEIAQIKSADLRSKSSSNLLETQRKYNEFHSVLKKSEAKMNPVLVKLKDQVLFLKHNLNAQAITGLKKESGKIQNDIEDLMKEMNASITQAEAFIKSM